MTNKMVNIVVDDKGQKHYALEGMTTITTLFGEPAKIAISQTMINTPFGERIVTTVWMFPFKNGCHTFEKDMYVGSTVLNPADKFSYKQAVINALTDVSKSYFVLSAGKNLNSNDRYLAFCRQYDYDDTRIDAALARWARSEGRKLFNDEHGVLGDLDNNPRVQRFTAQLNNDGGSSPTIERITPLF